MDALNYKKTFESVFCYQYHHRKLRRVILRYNCHEEETKGKLLKLHTYWNLK